MKIALIFLEKYDVLVKINSAGETAVSEQQSYALNVEWIQILEKWKIVSTLRQWFSVTGEKKTTTVNL